MSETILKEVVLPAAFNKSGSRFIDCEFDDKYKAQDNFQSAVFFLTATVVKGEDTVKLPLVVKFQPKDENVRRDLNTSVQFYNEILMYEKLIPLVNQNNICETAFPTFHYGVGTLKEPDRDVIVIEDLRPKGFRLTEEKVFLDLQHLQLAMKKLGKFHALSYVAKKENASEFYKLVGKLKEPWWVAMNNSSETMISPTIQKCFHRALDPLIASGRHASVLRRLLARVDDSVIKFLQDLVAPEEPVAVLCHGDFCRNNMLYSYTPDSSGPVEVRFFDLATARYSSPAVDIAFFLLMNSSTAVRAAHWDDLLSSYHAALSSTVTSLSRDVTVPSLQRLQQEMRLKFVYGFVHASFFLPMMLWGDSINIEELTDVPAEDMGCMNAGLGGEEGTKLLMDMAEELVERGCLTLDHPFLKDVGA